MDLELFFDEEEFQRAGLPKKVQMAWEKFFSFLREKEHKRSGKIQFESRAEAEEFTNQAVAYPKQRIDRLLEQIRLQVEKRIAQTQSDFAALLEKEAQPILERANERLKRSFNINLTLPNPHLQPSVKFVKPRIEHKTELIDQGYEESVVMERHIWHWLWIIPYERKIKVKRPDKKEDRYEVALDEIVTQINQLIEQSVEQMKQGVSNYLGDKLRTQIDDFFSRLNHHFASYQENLQQAQRDKELSVEQQSSLVEEIRILSISIAECSEKMATYFEYANSLVINE